VIPSIQGDTVTVHYVVIGPKKAIVRVEARCWTKEDEDEARQMIGSVVEVLMTEVVDKGKVKATAGVPFLVRVVDAEHAGDGAGTVRDYYDKWGKGQEAKAAILAVRAAAPEPIKAEDSKKRASPAKPATPSKRYAVGGPSGPSGLVIRESPKKDAAPKDASAFL
jgi:hypothetical protein